MTLIQAVFVLFAILTLGAGLFTVLSRHLFHAVLYLILSLVGVAGLFVLLEAEFLAGVQVLIYIGAISILIIFAVMLTRGMARNPGPPLNNQSLAAAVIAGLFFVLLAPVIAGFPWPQATQGVPADAIEALGRSLVDPNQFALPFELASVMILAALIGAIFIAREKR
ncbi:NADH-quinone oxidoreductase subunit J [Thermoflexus sp.]|uniref:NADH-quinone oxidoreductase subunit J family protein n=1 Tax=Thermoflexus sp. TaxID=1969742 RepID=UPI0025FEF747|nr:NADH-quinone oxidoreductase subunit J [Thermoflexus sp.]MDW8065450.1 NADH-quinone oxidoreductase subunit J [Anaerolineae bacterium]MCS6963580.1 NADH-quinone oxidoreductase subunit J [Thermoflexus sp.]MCS7350305.1 NADH-quinone oxidoreductase subunit J [Thermoflexus sp.]MCX7689630.1 NADH-quinone oxidoreductase subunit J [Thermoflexus sp.]MDW8179756.1 NADH-quinone oxidoreductase subunit J [Anaerolineae bacterium]